MSTRALRRMQVVAASASSHVENDETDEDDVAEQNQGVTGNKFDFLLPDDEPVEEDGKGDNESDGSALPSSASALVTSKKRKKKNKKTRVLAKEEHADKKDEELLFEPNMPAASSSASNEYFDDMVVKSPESTTRSENLCNSLGINVKDSMSLNPKYLNSAHEVRYRFGAQAAGGATAPHLRGAHRTAQRRSLQSRLVTPRPNWPVLTRSGLSMRPLDPSANSNAGIPTFTFEHDNTYSAAQQEFWTAVESLSPDEIAAVHRRHPYHIDTLLQLAELCLTADDPQSAADLVERAVYAMETGLHHNFILTRLGSRVLDFRYFESRSFYLALFRHITLLGKKGCTRTSFELSKLLLSLDFRRDPMCALLFIDFYALRANCNSELIAIYDELWRDKSLDWLPNFAYSIPLALFRLTTAAGASSKALLPTAPAESILVKAKFLMFEALSRFPSVLIPLLESCSVKPDGRLAACKWFIASQTDAKDEPNALKALQSLYVLRCSSVWKDIETLRWLESVVAEFVETLVTEERNRRILRDKAVAAFKQPCGRNVLRHLVLSGHREPIGFVSSELPFTAAIFSYDPLPPADAIWTYTRNNPRRGRGAGADASSPLDLFASFFASLLPNFNPAEQNQVQVRFDNFIRAFRDVLAGLHLEAPPLEAAGQQPQQGNQQQQQFDLADLTDSSDDEQENNNNRADHDELD